MISDRLAYAITRWKNITLQGMFYRQTRVRPDKVKSQLLGLVRRRQGFLGLENASEASPFMEQTPKGA